MSSSKISNNFIKFIKPDFIHSDNRGSLVQLCSKGKWNQVNFIKSEQGSKRGNHYHEINRELFYVIKGRFNLTLEIDNDKFTYDIIAEDMFIIEPLVRHSFEYVEETMLISMYDKGVELDFGKMDLIT
jgi:quercetin dioxygenase-like cupin family protein